MNNKVLINLLIPEIDLNYDIYLPVNKKIGNIIDLLNIALKDINEKNITFSLLYNVDTGKIYEYDEILLNTNIRNGTKLVLLR